ncbi:MAG: DNA translocase FtsK [Deltaproteobacteria bacterium]|nr:DNA translocase FtsK [Deltaproteobacteria bacterium]
MEFKKKSIRVSGKGIEYKSPPIDLLEKEKGKPSAGDIKTNSRIIKKTLESFEIPVEMSGVNVGPTVTQYSLKPAEGIKISKITSLSNDMALALATHPIRIEAPIPGKSLVGIEVPNKVRSLVRLRDLMQAPEFSDHPSDLVFCLGKDVSGHPMYANLGKMPHLLVAGSTGTGKTIFLNTLILSLLYRNSPDRLKLILIDPKRVEFSIYSSLPHLLCPAIVDSSKAVNALKWLIDEMDRRFKELAKVRARNIYSYNEKSAKNDFERLPYIILIIDELADLMAAKGREVETSVVRLAQMARAVGIHLVVATQRPSVEVITGLIKANITSRITFQVASQVDSRTVLDTSGAEKLLGAGDMLFISSEIVKPKRMQAAYISEKEVKKVVDWIKTEFEVIEGEDLKDSLSEALRRESEAGTVDPDDFSSQEDSLYEEAKRVIIQHRKASASLLQRKLRIGYARAARLIDTLEERGLVGPSQGAKPREVYIRNADNQYGEDSLEREENDEQWHSV